MSSVKIVFFSSSLFVPGNQRVNGNDGIIGASVSILLMLRLFVIANARPRLYFSFYGDMCAYK